MSAVTKRRKPVTPTFIVLSRIIVLGVVISLAGLVMLVLGDGVATPTTLQVPNINLNVSTSSLPLIVMAAGLGVTVAALGLLVGYTRAYNASGRKLLLDLIIQHPDASPDKIKAYSNLQLLQMRPQASEESIRAYLKEFEAEEEKAPSRSQE